MPEKPVLSQDLVDDIYAAEMYANTLGLSYVSAEQVIPVVLGNHDVRSLAEQSGLTDVETIIADAGVFLETRRESVSPSTLTSKCGIVYDNAFFKVLASARRDASERGQQEIGRENLLRATVSQGNTRMSEILASHGAKDGVFMEICVFPSQSIGQSKTDEPMRFG